MKPKAVATLALAVSLSICLTAEALVVEKVDLAGDWQLGGARASIDVDGLDHVHITYRGVANDLKYTTNITGSWVTETVDPGAGAFDSPTIALDGSNKVHISWCDETNEALKYSTNISGSWLTETVDTSAAGRSLALDGSDKVHVSYAKGGDVLYATNASGSWIAETVDTSGVDSSIALDSSDNVHIIYTRDDGLMYATNTSGSWVTEAVDTNGARSSISLDSLDNVHITYGFAGLRYATNVTGAWVTETVIEAEYGWPRWSVGGSPSIAVDGSDNVHISSISGDGYIFGLQYSINATGTWMTGDMGMGCLGLPPYSTASIAVDSTDTVHVGFSALDLQDMNLKLMVASTRCAPEICDN